MAKIEKLVSKLLSHPRDLTWEELVKILSHYGYHELRTGKTGGSKRKFVDGNKNIISLHEPHSAKNLKHYQINQVIAHLKEKGKI